MKIRKALEKAKQGSDEGVNLDNSFQVAERPRKKDWCPPIYSESRTISIAEKTAKDNRCIGIQSGSPLLESYKVLRTQIIQRTANKGWNTIMITSVEPGDGKTLTAINLAFTFSREFHQTTLLVDGDLKNQQIHKYLGYESPMGIGEYLIADEELSNLIVWPGIEKLTIISGGTELTDSTELLSSPRMRSLVTEMKSRYKDRLILFDMPPVLGRADAAAFAPLVDCIVLVVEWGKTSNKNIKEALKLIPEEKLLGFVINRAKH